MDWIRLLIASDNPPSGRSVSGWAVAFVGAALAFWFFIGVFPVWPTVIASGSMRPALEVGDIAIVAQQNPACLQPGDIIQYRTRDMPIPTVHRVIETKKESGATIFITKGDDNKNPDTEPVRADQLKGKVVLVVPKAGWVTITIKKLTSLKTN